MTHVIGILFTIDLVQNIVARATFIHDGVSWVVLDATFTRVAGEKAATRPGTVNRVRHTISTEVVIFFSLFPTIVVI